MNFNNFKNFTNKIIFLLVSIFILSCETLQNSAKEISRSFIEENKPDITIKSAKLKSVTIRDITLECVLDIKNNLPMELPIEKIEIELINTEGKIFSTANSVESLKIPSEESRSKTINFNAKYIDVFSTAFSSLKNKNLKCVSKTYLTFTIANMNFRFPYTKDITFIE